MDTPPIGDGSAPVGNGPATADLVTAQRWSEATRYVERITRGGKPFPVGPTALEMRPFVKVQVGSSAIAAAGSTATPVGGTAQICDFVGGTWVPNGQNITVYNPGTGESIAANAYVTAGWVGGIWEVILDPC